jgi:hypothetical protein
MLWWNEGRSHLDCNSAHARACWRNIKSAPRKLLALAPICASHQGVVRAERIAPSLEVSGRNAMTRPPTLVPVRYPGPTARIELNFSDLILLNKMVPRGGLSLKLSNISKINDLKPPQMTALYQANVPMSTVKWRWQQHSLVEGDTLTCDTRYRRYEHSNT